MWLEGKIILSIVSWVIIAIVISQLIYFQFLFAVLLLAAIFINFFGDLIIGYGIKSNHVDVLIDPNPTGHETVILCDFGGNVDFASVKKGPLGKREFVRYGKEASIINRGKYPIRLPNGNHGCIAHESYDLDVKPATCEALDKLKGDDIKEVVEHLEEEDKMEDIEGGVMND